MNKLKNEAEVRLGAETYILRPTFANLIAIEGKTKKSLVQLVNATVSNAMPIEDTIAVLVEGSKGTEKPLVRTDVITILDEHGIVPVQMALGDFFAKALYGGKAFEDDTKKKEEVKTETKESTGSNSLDSLLHS